MKTLESTQPRYLAYGENADGITVDRQAHQIVLSNHLTDQDKREALLKLALQDGRVMKKLSFMKYDEDRNRALKSLQTKILGGSLSRNPLDIQRVIDGSSFSGWVYKIFKLIVADAERKGEIQRARIVSIESVLTNDNDNIEQVKRNKAVKMGITMYDRPNPYQSIVMRRPIGSVYHQTKQAVRKNDGNRTNSLDAGLAVLSKEHWNISDETDVIDERLILSVLLPELTSHEKRLINTIVEGLGRYVDSKETEQLHELWKILDSAYTKTGIPSMVLWEKATHALFDARWTPFTQQALKQQP